MSITARDLWPLVLKLPHDEQLRLARIALRQAAKGAIADAPAYASLPVSAEEFGEDDDDPLAWDADGWEGFS
jgi:hypothetical protein